jgi:hypothetical protein
MRYPFRWRLNRPVMNSLAQAACTLATDPRTYFNLAFLTSLPDQSR